MPLPAQQAACVNGQTMTWRERGDGPPIVFIHGIGGSSESWRPAFETVARSYRIMAWDAPGYGGSSLEAIEPTASAYAQRLHSLLKWMDIAPRHLVAHSIGSPIAAALFQLLPSGCVETITLVHPLPGFGGLDATQRDALRAARLADIDGMTMLDFGKLRAPQIMGTQTAPAIVDEVAGIIGRIPEAGYRAMVEVMSSANLNADLPSIPAPTLVIAGTADTIAAPDACRAVVEALPCGKYEEYEHVGHYAPLERPDELSSSLQKFVTLENRT